MSRILQLTDIAHNLYEALQSLDVAGLPLTAALIDLAVNQVEEEISKMDQTFANLDAYGSARFALLDNWVLRVFD